MQNADFISDLKWGSYEEVSDDVGLVLERMEAGPVVANIARMGYQPRKQSLLKGQILGPESNEALSSWDLKEL